MGLGGQGDKSVQGGQSDRSGQVVQVARWSGGLGWDGQKVMVVKLVSLDDKRSAYLANETKV